VPDLSMRYPAFQRGMDLRSFHKGRSGISSIAGEIACHKLRHIDGIRCMDAWDHWATKPEEKT
jgi:hypothetical protein